MLDKINNLMRFIYTLDLSRGAITEFCRIVDIKPEFYEDIIHNFLDYDDKTILVNSESVLTSIQYEYNKWYELGIYYSLIGFLKTLGYKDDYILNEVVY